MATSGSLRIDVIEAKLTRDTEVFSKMDPYAVLECRMQKFRTRTLQGAGKTPNWSQAFDFDVKYVGDDMTIKVFDEDVSSSDLVSWFYPPLLIYSFRLVNPPSRSPPCVLELVSMNGSPFSIEASSLVPST